MTARLPAAAPNIVGVGQNIELKFEIPDPEVFARRCEGLGARRVWCRRQHDTFFDLVTAGERAGVSLAHLPEAVGDLLRDALKAPSTTRLKLRIEEHEDGTRERRLIAYHRADTSGPKASDFRIEFLRPSDAKLLEGILPQASPAMVVKQRTLWVLRNTRIHIDRVEGLTGVFGELETRAEGRDADGAGWEHACVIEGLNIAQKHRLVGAYRDLLQR